MRKAHGLGTHKPWTENRHNTFLGLRPTKRVLELINLAYMLRLGTTQGVASLEQQEKEVLENMFVDISQNPCRKPWSGASGSSGTSPCLTTSAVLYSFDRDSLVLPLELLFFQGHAKDIRLPQTMKQAAIRDLAGEGICLPCLATILAGLSMSGLLAHAGPRQ